MTHGQIDRMMGQIKLSLDPTWQDAPEKGWLT